MCGIVGYVGTGEALPVILSGLQRLEYRGYDSAGVAIYQKGRVKVARAVGKLEELRKVLENEKAENGGLTGALGIGHTRWATHGRPVEHNAHPHTAGRVSLIHNGIIENYLELKEKLKAQGRVFRSDTDTEVAAHLLDTKLSEGLEPFEALRKTCAEIRGSYAFLAIDSEHPDRILVAKNSTPIVIGRTKDASFVASDIPAILEHTREVIVLEDGDFAEVRQDGVWIENDKNPVERPIRTITWDPVTAQKGGFKHFMLKEIHDQGNVLGESFRGRIDPEAGTVHLDEVTLSESEIRSIDRIILVACGTAWHACLLGKFYLEQFTGIPCEVDYASEFRYRQSPLSPTTLVIPVSQSGETADTIAATERALAKTMTLAVCNVLGSTLSRKVKNTVFTHAGPEISVASTKAFTTQVTVLYLTALFLGQKRGTLDKERSKELLAPLLHLPAAVDESLKSVEGIEKIAKAFHSASDYLFLGRGTCYPVALEGALKLKEISYIHAEGYPAGEMKHGPIALIDEKMPVVVIVQRSALYEKVLSNMKEVESRGGQIIIVTDHENLPGIGGAAAVVNVPFVSEELSPILLTIPLQLLAYYTAVYNGTDVDLPRNLAKSVTVE